MEDWLQESHNDAFDAQYHHWQKIVENDPVGTLQKIEDELRVLYIRMDNDQEGRGIVADTTIGASIAGLEAIRAECRELVKARTGH